MNKGIQLRVLNQRLDFSKLTISLGGFKIEEFKELKIIIPVAIKQWIIPFIIKRF